MSQTTTPEVTLYKSATRDFFKANQQAEYASQQAEYASVAVLPIATLKFNNKGRKTGWQGALNQFDNIPTRDKKTTLEQAIKADEPLVGLLDFWPEDHSSVEELITLAQAALTASQQAYPNLTLIAHSWAETAKSRRIAQLVFEGINFEAKPHWDLADEGYYSLKSSQPLKTA